MHYLNLSLKPNVPMNSREKNPFEGIESQTVQMGYLPSFLISDVPALSPVFHQYCFVFETLNFKTLNLVPVDYNEIDKCD